MALPTTREKLKTYCLRKLGAPVINVDVANEQIEDRIDEALEMFQQYHFDGVEKIYLAHKLTASIMTFTAPPGTFTRNESLVGTVSGASAAFYDQTGSTARVVLNPTSVPFQASELVTGSQSGATGTLAATNFYTVGDLENRYVTIGEDILSVIDILALNTSNSGMFDVRYQFFLNNMPNFTSMDLISYDMLNKHLALLQFEFEGIKPLRHNKKQNRIYVDFDWSSDANVDRYVVFEALRAMDPAQWPKIWGDYWLREYSTALIKKQWGQNLIKFKNVQLPGPTQLNGEDIYNQAITELEVLDEKLHKEFQEPVSFLVG